MIILILLLVLIEFGLIALMIVSMWKIFTKSGQEGWISIIPIYNTIVMLRIVGKPWWWLFLMMIPFAGIVWGIWILNLLSKSFGKHEGFTVGMIFLPFIFMPILGLGSAQYVGQAGNNFQPSNTIVE